MNKPPIVIVEPLLVLWILGFCYVKKGRREMVEQHSKFERALKRLPVSNGVERISLSKTWVHKPAFLQGVALGWANLCGSCGYTYKEASILIGSMGNSHM